MATIADLKEQTATETPLLLFDCALRSGDVERWSTHRVTFEGETYEARVLKHNMFETQAGSGDGIDAASKISVTLANADSRFSEIERNTGWKGARVTVRFVFFDLKSGAGASESRVLFRGIADSPEEITETTFRLSVMNSLSLQRVLLPELRIQRRCPWRFPACGYAAGSLGNGSFESCSGTRAECEERGMFSQDAAGRATRRFAGIEFVPPTTMVRTHGDKSFHVSTPVTNEARYNDFVPLVYGTAWYRPPIVYAKNDGNLTRMEVLLGAGEMHGILKVLVNDVEIPMGQSGRNMTATGWYNFFATGTETGAFNPDSSRGDPYGGMAALSVVVPNAINDGRSLPKLEVLVQGLKLSQYDAAGAYVGEAFSNNPAWVLLNVLRRCGWGTEDIDTASFAAAAARCGELIEARDINGNTVWTPRFQCNLALLRRRSAADLIRGVRCGSRLLLRYGPEGKLQLLVEDSLARQQNGYPAYEFGPSRILRQEKGAPSLRVYSRSTAETANRLSVEFQDEFNAYQQDSLSLVNSDDIARTGQEVSATLPALGIPHFDQAARVLRFQLDKSILGNTYLELETSVRGVGVCPGDIITVTYLKEGFDEQAFRVLRVAPGLNYQTVLITAQIHDDEWYRDDNAQGLGYGDSRRQARAEMGAPRPIAGAVWDENGEQQLALAEQAFIAADGTGGIRLTAGFIAPERTISARAGVPLICLATQIAPESGTLEGGQTLYYAVSALDDDGAEGALSFAARATIPAGSDANSVTLTGLSFASGAAGFRVYRGETPQAMLLVAERRPVASEFTDTGLIAELAVPPDANYDHANFYWRYELLAQTAAEASSASTVGNAALRMKENEFRGAAVRIVVGKGSGQERTVISNDATTLTVAPAFGELPDATSEFVVVSSSWHFGAAAAASPVSFEVTNVGGSGIEVTGRAANVQDRECSAELSPLTRWRVQGAGGADADVPGRPIFGLLPMGSGTITVDGIAFEDLANTSTITSAMLTLSYWNEFESPTAVHLASDATEETIELTAEGLYQVEQELVAITAQGVERGAHGTTAAAHAAGTPVYALRQKVYIIPFARDFFRSGHGGDFSHPIYLPDARIARAEMVVTNCRGQSPAKTTRLTGLVNDGLRTLSGGQFTMQVEGFLATENNAVPPLKVQDSHAVRDVFAMVREAPAGGPVELRVRQGAATYCTLTVPEGATYSESVNGFGLPPLEEDSELNLDVVSVPQSAGSRPGRDLTVTVRL